LWDKIGTIIAGNEAKRNKKGEMKPGMILSWLGVVNFDGSYWDAVVVIMICRVPAAKFQSKIVVVRGIAATKPHLCID
jgi:hypothetical protein